MISVKIGGWLVLAGLLLVIGTKLMRLSAPWFVVAVPLCAVAAVFAITLVWQLPPRQIVTVAALGILASVLVFTICGQVSRPARTPKVNFTEVIPGSRTRDTLFVLIHGLQRETKDTWCDVQPELLRFGDVIALNYDSGPMANSEPYVLAMLMADKINRVYRPEYDKVVLIGHSIGALLTRQVYLIGEARRDAWIARTKRLVLLAGMNRGWDVTGQKPMDMSYGRQLTFWISAWFGRLTNTGRLILSTEIGAPFVSNLRLRWLRRFRTLPPEDTPVVVQLLGDIDDVVTDADNQDLSAASGPNFYWLRVRGTGHGDIVRFSDHTGANANYAGIGPYRRDKVLLAATEPDIAKIAAQNEVQAFETNPNVRHIVFVLHGIRDLGEWAASFEEELRSKLPRGQENTLAVVSVRYGFFSMASFLFRPDRQKFVRWFMDQYTETLAHYPNTDRVDFIGHSNGTYLLASALQKYASLQVDRIVFAGSVVRRDYDWEALFMNGQVEAVRNYMGTRDAVVAIFPRFFEPRVMRLLGNDVGSAGFNGFTRFASRATFQQTTIDGGHSAFHNIVPQIADFVLADAVPPVPTAPPAAPTSWQKLWADFLKFHSSYMFFLVPVLLIILVVFPGIRVATAAGHQAWIPTLLYVALVVFILKRL